MKWICGFTNAQGGRIYIGMNDNGIVTGMSDYRKLMEDIPNKVIAAFLKKGIELSCTFADIGRGNTIPTANVLHYLGHLAVETP